MPLPTAAENPQGLHSRYHVTKVSGEPTDERAEYFVLRIDSFGHDAAHVAACRAAAEEYARVVLASPSAAHLHGIARDIVELVGCPECGIDGYTRDMDGNKIRCGSCGRRRWD